jgi:hypothetical protein
MQITPQVPAFALGIVHRREEAGKAALEDAERLRADRLVAVQQVVNRWVPSLEVLVQAVGAGRQVRLVSCSLWFELVVTRIILLLQIRVLA